MDDVDVGPLQHLAEVRVAGDARGRGLQRPRQVAAVHVAHGPQHGPGVAEVLSAHPADADHGLGQRVARGNVARPAQDVARHDGQRGRGDGRAPGELPAGDPGGMGHERLLSTGSRIIVTAAWRRLIPSTHSTQALEARHLAELTFKEVRHGLQALSSLYVERRERMAGGTALDGAGKRAAFALYYGPLHFLLVREIVRALALRTPRRILDLGCGTGTAGAAWALEAESRARLEGVDHSGWAVDGGPLDATPASVSTAGRREATRRALPCRSRRPASSPRSP